MSGPRACRGALRQGGISTSSMTAPPECIEMPVSIRFRTCRCTGVHRDARFGYFSDISLHRPGNPRSPSLSRGGTRILLLMLALPRSAHQSTGAVAGLLRAKVGKRLKRRGVWGLPQCYLRPRRGDGAAGELVAGLFAEDAGLPYRLHRQRVGGGVLPEQHYGLGLLPAPDVGV